MSRAQGIVRFSNGDVFFCIYNGTSDIMQPWLYKTRAESWNPPDRKTRRWPEGEFPDEEIVEVYSDYGGGFHWRAKASRSAMVLTDYLANWFLGEELMAYDEEGAKAYYDFIQQGDGAPDWVKGAWGSE